MYTKFYILTILLQLVLQITITKSKYLAEKPPYLTPCDFNDANYNKCFAKNLLVLFHEWKDGVPGLKSVAPLDPLHVKRLKIVQNNGGPINLNAELENVVATGASEINIKSVVQGKDYEVEATVELPKLTLNSDYKAKGTILGLNINGQGKAVLEASKVLLNFHITVKLRDEGDFTFTDIATFKSKILQVGDFRINLQNLFGGQKELEDAAHVLINQNWRELLKILQPALEQALELVLKDRFTKIFAYVPSNYFRISQRKASEIYG